MSTIVFHHTTKLTHMLIKSNESASAHVWYLRFTVGNLELKDRVGLGGMFSLMRATLQLLLPPLCGVIHAKQTKALSIVPSKFKFKNELCPTFPSNHMFLCCRAHEGCKHYLPYGS